MILTGSEIRKAQREKKISIIPFRESHINPNSYNYRLGKTLLCYEKSNLFKTREIKIPKTGFVLKPKNFYLGSTLEAIGSTEYAISLIGRSSIGRLGIHIQLSADLGHTGTHHSWTLEIIACHPVRIYPAMLIGQVSFWKNIGRISLYDGIYKQFSEPKEAISEKLRRDI